MRNSSKASTESNACVVPKAVALAIMPAEPAVLLYVGALLALAPSTVKLLASVRVPLTLYCP